MKKLLLIDAYAMIFRAYYAFIRAPRINSKGENMSAIYGFLITLEDLKKRVQPTHIGVAFDPHGPTFRHEAYEQYKAQREETPEDIRKAVPVIKSILEAMRIPVLEVPGYEADDVIGTLAGQAEQQGFDVLMATPDKDYGQLVTERSRMYRPRHSGGFEEMGPQEVCEKYGISSTGQVIDLLGLMGDASDNIPGCAGVGEKTAVKLLQQFGSIEEMLSRTDEIKGALRTKVEEHADDIRFSKFLATIKTDVPVTLDAEALLVKEPDYAALTALYTELEFRSLLKRFEGAGSGTSTSNRANGADSSNKTNGTGRSNGTAQKSAEPTLFDTAEPTLFTQSEPDLFSQGDLFSQAPDMSVLSEEDKQAISIAHYLLQPEMSHDPEYLCTIYHCKPDELKERVLSDLKKDEKLMRLYTEIELPLAPILKEMTAAGVRFDVQILREASAAMHTELDGLEQEILSMAGTPININSPKQVGDLLFGEMRLDPKAKKTKGGQYVTSEEVLQALKGKHPIVGKILEYRELKKLLSTYIDTLPSLINPQTGKIHTTYNQTVTATGRLSSSSPNLQNLPIRSERGKFIRKAVIPDDGCKFVSADYSQIELRLMAHFSGDEHMLEAFRSGQDIHAATAAKIFGCPLTEVTKEQRRRAKTANFGIIYGISAFGLAQQLDCSRLEAQQLINDYFQAFPGVVQFIEASKERARQQGYVETAFGRRRYLPDIHSHNATVRSFAERNAVNAPIQGTAADIIKIAMVRIHRRLQAEHLQAQMIMQVHDELNFNVPEHEVETLKKMVVEEMQGAMQLQIPLIVECGVGENWLEAH
ncbi:MAG: DNA polymerase I [Paludibacteraceae bacterium]|nr:DNA polymerase I [Paludibacteraceae bacterium]